MDNDKMNIFVNKTFSSGELININKDLVCFNNSLFVEGTLKMPRKNGKVFDKFPIYFPYHIAEDNPLITEGSKLTIEGKFGTRNAQEVLSNGDLKSRLLMFILAKEVYGGISQLNGSQNTVEINGIVGNSPVIRMTPVSKQKIAEVTLVAPNGYGEEAFYPRAITWNKGAEAVVGQKSEFIATKGFAASRGYVKAGEQDEIRTALEYNIQHLKIYHRH